MSLISSSVNEKNIEDLLQTKVVNEEGEIIFLKKLLPLFKTLVVLTQLEDCEMNNIITSKSVTVLGSCQYFWGAYKGSQGSANSGHH